MIPAAMLSHLTLRNFRRFREFSTPLHCRTLIAGPPASGKSTLLEALALWRAAIESLGSRQRKGTAGSDTGSLALKDVPRVATPARLLWRGWHTRSYRRFGDQHRTDSIPLSIEVSGHAPGNSWTCAVEFEYTTDDILSFRVTGDAAAAAGSLPLVFPEPPETRLPALLEAVNRDSAAAAALSGAIRHLMGVQIAFPESETPGKTLQLEYEDRAHNRLPLACGGSGLNDALATLALLHSHRNAALLLEQPGRSLDAWRRDRLWRRLTAAAIGCECQLIATGDPESLPGADSTVWLGGHQAPEPLSGAGAREAGWWIGAPAPSLMEALRLVAERISHPVAPLLWAAPVIFARDWAEIRRKAPAGIPGIWIGTGSVAESWEEVEAAELIAPLQDLLASRPLFHRFAERLGRDLNAGPLFLEPALAAVWDQHAAPADRFRAWLERLGVPLARYPAAATALASVAEPADCSPAMIQAFDRLHELAEETGAV